MKTENVMNALTGGIVLMWLVVTDFGVFLLASIAGVLVLTLGVMALTYLFAGADGALRWITARARELSRPAVRPSIPRMAGNLMKRA